ncbi:MAG: hypothetical protein DCC67_12930 [Planctomycetota bacterium]|nr:MAG: hypothetical protein DCC67_12930 [Planctomycetota bacterium]
MSSSLPSRDGSSQGSAPERYGRGAVSSDELLPPVEPPSAAFLMQLFVVPAVIVAAVVLVWFVIESLARRGEQDPDQIVAALRSNNQARFQQAKDLADMLRLPQRYPQIKTNRELAQKIAEYVNELVAAGSTAEADVTMRYFLVTALGEFHVPDGLPALIGAALNDPERDVRRRAINALAVLAGSMAERGQPLASEKLTAALLELAEDRDPLIRSEAAFTIGVVAAAPGADPRLAAALETLADDAYTDARFNAAVGLVRIGSPRAADALAEMLDPDSIRASLAGEKPLNASVTAEAVEANKTNKRNTILNTALDGIKQLLERPELPPESAATLRQALRRFLEAAPEMNQPAPVPRELIEKAGRALQRAGKEDA